MEPPEDDNRTKKSPRINLVRSLGDVIIDAERILEGHKKEIPRIKGMIEELYAIERAVIEDDCAARKFQLVKLARLLAGAIADAERMLDRNTAELSRIERAVMKLYATEKEAVKNSTSTLRRRSPKPSPPVGPPPAVRSFQLDANAKGGAVVSFDGGNLVPLPPALTALIAILTSGDGESLDEFVAWRSPDRIRELLQKRLGRVFSRHSVSQLLWRLQGKLGAAGLDVRLIERSPLGVRLRLKKHSTALLAE